MHSIVLLTPTFNRSNKITTLYNSLSHQTDKDFTWVVVDDGSTDDTETVFKALLKNSSIDIVYFKKDNGGKSNAINAGLDLLTNEEFVLILDDDEKLFSNAVSTIRQYVNKYANSGCVAIDFNHIDSTTKKILSNYHQKDDYFMTVQTRKRKKIDSDGYTGYFVKYVLEERFPVYPDEKYVAPSVLLMSVSNKYGKILWAKESLGETEYSNDGLTKQGKKLRINNPNGMVDYCYQFMFGDATFLTKIKYSIYGYSWMQICKKVKHRSIERKKYSRFYFFCSFLGFLYGKHVIRKFLKKS